MAARSPSSANSYASAASLSWRGRIAGAASARGFSLVEVVIALGVISFALLALLAIVPLSLKTYQEASERTIQVAIVDQISARAQKTPFSQLSTLTSQNLVYDRAGDEVAPASPEAFFSVKLSMDGTAIPSSPPVVSSNLVTLKVELSTIGKPGSTRTFNLHVANAGH
ncbi:hypothetical protein DB346_16845 [Verrucomicrobia bacterium LW23]|nr:hypothetical protein DB346_16845 [Verrucomicrobia bacterium LW23]